MYLPQFLRAINFVLSARVEGDDALSLDTEDPGNWTGGVKGKGDLKGTKWGISAASYPHLDIAALRRDDVIPLYKKDYWDRVKGDQLPPRLGIAVFDCCVNQGVEVASKLLQKSVGAEVDGSVGPETLSRIKQRETDDVLVDFLAQRALLYSRTKNFDRYGHGWLSRLFLTAMESTR